MVETVTRVGWDQTPQLLHRADLCPKAWAADRFAWNRRYALAAAALAALGYDWLLVPPTYSLICETEEGWAAVALFFATVAVAGELSARWK